MTRHVAPVESGEVAAAHEPVRTIDPRAVRLALAPASLHPQARPMVVRPSSAAEDGLVMVDDQPLEVRLHSLDAVRGVLVEGHGAGAARSAVILMPLERADGPASGTARREVIVDGWRIEVEIEPERRAELRDRARRGRGATTHGGPTEVRASIPGRVVSLSVAPGDTVGAGQQLLVVEAMKMQNELRAPRDGVVARVAVGAGATIELGDLLVVLE